MNAQATPRQSRHNRIANALAGALAALLVWPANAESVGAPMSEDNPGTFTFQWDNDKVADTDRHYTNGMRVGYSVDAPTGLWLTTGRALADFARFPVNRPLRAGWAVGQDMFTPEDVDSYVPDPTDRPYAGWTYLAVNVQTEDQRRLDSFDVNVGVIGPASKAAQTQNAFHRQINVSVSRGWRHQINNELGVLLTRSAKWRSDPWMGSDIFGEPLGDGLGGELQADVIGHATGQLGNVRTGAGLGGTVRIGGNLKEDFGPTYSGADLPAARPNRSTYAFFVGGETRAVAWDVFLDGNTFRDSPDVKKNPYVLEGRTGLTAHWPLDGSWRRFTGIRGVRASLTLVHRTREFKTQHKADRYGSLSVMVNF